MFFSYVRSGIHLLLLLILLQCSTSIRVYRPVPNESPFEVIKTFPKLSVLSSHPNPERFALYSPYIYATKGLPFFGEEYDLKNEYGNFSYLIRKELSIRPEHYQQLVAEGGKIEIKEFVFESVDHCYANDVTINLKIDVQIGKRKVETFTYSDQIHSYISDCYLTGSILTIIPLVWYVPYAGFRGNREDQLNELGRNAVEAYFQFLESLNGYVPKSASTPNKPSVPLLNEQATDPKIKEIMDNL